MENTELENLDPRMIDELIEELHINSDLQSEQDNAHDDAVSNDEPDVQVDEPENNTEDEQPVAESESAASEAEIQKESDSQSGDVPEPETKPEEDKLHALPSQFQRDALIVRIAQKKRYRRILTATVTVMLLIAAAAVFIALIMCPVIKISGSGMEPTYQSGDIIVLFNTKDYETGELICVTYQNKLLVKRVIATAGETVSIDENGNVSVNGALLDEPYVINKSLGECDIEFPYVVPEGGYFVMGDRRDTSVDSRSTLVGSVDEKDILGKVLIKVWPLDGNQ